MLGIYKYPSGVGQISEDESFSNPIVWSAPSTGATIEQTFYLRMNSPSAEYLTDGLLYCTDLGDTDESGWVQFALDVAGVAGTYGPTLSFDLAADEELKFWIMIDIPTSWSPNPKYDLRIACDYTRHII
jgi:hypothetical protein